jgi:hypothetical protein
MRWAEPDRADIPPYEALLAIKSSSGANGMTVGGDKRAAPSEASHCRQSSRQLEARKLATRKRAITDRRKVNVQLTKAGASLLAGLAAIHHRELQQRSPEIIDPLRRIRE